MPASQQDRKLVEVYNMIGGLNTSGDPSSMQPNEWRDCQNMVVARVQVGPNSSTTQSLDLVAASHPGITNNTSNTAVALKTFLPAAISLTGYPQPYKCWTLATGQNSLWPSETWTAGGTGTQSYQNTFSLYGNQCVRQVNTASQNTTSTITVTAMDSTFIGNMTALLLDSNWTTNANFASGYIRVGSDSSNYYQFNIASPGTDGNAILFFTWASPSSTTGSPNNNSIAYIQISTTATAGGTFTFKFNNLRWGSMTNSTTVINASGNIPDIFVYDITADGKNPQFIAACGDSLFISNAFSSGNINGKAAVWSQIMSKFTHWSLAGANTLTKTLRFNFSQLPDIKNSNPNNMVCYFVNGVDGFFSFNGNAAQGSMWSRIASTAYRYIYNYKNYMMLAGRGDKPNELDWSDLNDPSNLTTLASGNITLIQGESGQVITGLLPFDDYMFIFRMNDVYIFSGNSNNDFAVRRTKSKVGAIDQKYITKAGMQVFFMHIGGLYSLNWWDESNLLSQKVSDLLNPGNIDQFYAGYLVYNPLREILVLSIPQALTTDPQTSFSTSYRMTFSIPRASYGGNLIGGAWGKLGKNTTSDSIAFGAVYYAGASTVLSGGSYLAPAFFESGVAIYQWDGPSPDNVSMTYMIRTAWHTGGHPSRLKNFDKFGFFIRTQGSLILPTNPTIKTYTGFSDTAAQTVSTNTTPSGGYSEILMTPNSAQSVSASISATQANQTSAAIQVAGYTYVWTQDQVI